MVERRRFMAVCWGPGDPATTLAMLDDAGQLSDILFAGQLSGPIRHSRDGLFIDQSKVGLPVHPPQPHVYLMMSSHKSEACSFNPPSFSLFLAIHSESVSVTLPCHYGIASDELQCEHLHL